MSIEVDGKINREERLPCVLIVDGSDSMSANSDNAGRAIDLLNQALVVFQQDLQSDEIASLRVQVLVVRVGGIADVAADWADAINFAAPTIALGGGTPLGAGIDLALSKIDQQLDMLKAKGIKRKKPWIFLMTDGQPTDGQEWEDAAARLRQAQLDGKVLAFPIAIGSGSSPQELKKAVPPERPVVQVEAAKFKEMFKFISYSSRSASKGPEGAQQDMGMWGKVVA